MLLGFGCNVPGALSLRMLETRKERFITATLLGICIPCLPQIAIIASLVGPYGILGFSAVFGSLFVLWLVLGFAMNKLTGGEAPEILLDIPPYRVPYAPAMYKKLYMRVKGFFREAIPYVLLGVLVVNVLYSLGVIGVAERLLSPITTELLGLPAEGVGALLVGFLRKDVAVGMLRPLQTAGQLGVRQTIVACFVLAAYFPCFATFVMLVKELGVKDMIKSSIIMLTVAFGSATLLNWILRLSGV
jgi:ferrous iron transport protein B